MSPVTSWYSRVCTLLLGTTTVTAADDVGLIAAGRAAALAHILVRLPYKLQKKKMKFV